MRRDAAAVDHVLVNDDSRRGAHTVGPNRVGVLDLDDLDLDARAVAQDGTPFDSAVQNQRAALGLSRGVVHVAFRGHAADCGDFRGFVVGVRVTPDGAAGPVQTFATTSTGGGIWGPGGVAADERGVYVATGNTFNPPAWSLGESVLRLAPGPVFSGRSRD